MFREEWCGASSFLNNKERGTPMRIGIDVGGTKIAGGLIKDGRVIKRIIVPTDAHKGKAHILEQLALVIDGLSHKQKVERVGIGIPGTYRGTKILFLSHVPALNGVDLKKALKIKTPFHLENDAKCFAIAEHRNGAGKGTKNMIGIVIGTGVGSGIIIDGKIYRGANGDAGEVGHQLLPNGATWQEEISGPAILKRHLERGGKEDKVSLIWNAKSKAAKETQKEMIEDIAAFIYNLQVTFDPEIVVLGGGISCLPLVSHVNAQLKKLGGKAILKQNGLGIDAGIIGAAG